MYIKVKHIKRFLLVAVCFFLACFNYLNFVKADNKNDSDVCNKSIDADCDGLTDSEEKLYKTDPYNADSDNDGYSDGVEVKSGYDPLKSAPGDKIMVAESYDDSSFENNNSVKSKPTKNFSEKLKAFISSKGGKVTADDVKGFADEQLAGIMGEEITVDTLPEIDRSEINILEQNYDSLSEEKRKAKQKEDAAKYLEEMLYLLVSSAPADLATKEDFAAFQEDFISHLSEISDPGVDLKYFSDLGVRLEAFYEQAVKIEVPETMVDLHIKFFRIVKGVLSMKDLEVDSSDPLGRMVIFSKANNYIELISDFFRNDFSDYFLNLNK
ncbi:MAG: hypothetical protein GYA69_03005, partial [Candidatus Moranbacteria bacterium]|jgi:hypothetical protein|nr:hypothetical protein [Candidatus Moranbacteria bacterium]